MRRSILPILIALVVLFSVGGLVTWTFFKREREFQKVVIPVSYLETADTSQYSVQPILLSRNFPDDSLLIFFPPQNKRSQIFLYDQKNYNRLLFGDHHGVPLFLPDLEGMTAVFGQPVINMSGFPSGKYYVHVTACDFGGFISINITDSLTK